MAVPKDDWKTVALISERPGRMAGLETVARQVTDIARESRRNRRQAAGVSSILDFGGPAGSSIPSVLANNSAISSFLYTISRADKLQLFRYWCFTDPRTPITLEDGTERPLSEIQAGDRLINALGAVTTVKNPLVRDYDGDVIDLDLTGEGRKLIGVTPEHPFWVVREGQIKKSYQWIQAGDLSVGDLLVVPWTPGVLNNQFLGEIYKQATHQNYNTDGNILLPVKGANRRKFNGKVFNVETDGATYDEQSFLAYGLVTHNCNHDTMVGRAIDLHTELPMSRVTIGPPKGESPRQNREITRIYESMCDRMDLMGLLMEIAREIWICFDINNRVKIRAGLSKRLGDINIGDEVLTKSGRYRPVLAIKEKEIDEDICVIQACGLINPLRVTSEHQIFTDRGEKKAIDITPGDKLYYTPPQDQIPQDDITDDLCFLIGLYLCCGGLSCSSDTVYFSLGYRLDYGRSTEEITQLIQKCFPGEDGDLSVSNYSDNYGRYIWIEYNNSLAYKFFKSECNVTLPNGTSHSQLSERLTLLPKEQQALILRVWLAGGGEIYRVNSNQFDLTEQLHGLLARVSTEHYDLVSSIIDPDLSWDRPLPDGRIPLEVKSVERVRYQGKVRDLTVNEDSSYIVENATVHNCGDVYVWMHWNDELLEWDDVYVLPVEYMHSIIHPFNRKKEIIFFAKPLVDTAAIRRITDRDLYLVCLHPHTLIQMSSGKQKFIQDVEIGDEVISGDGHIRKVLDAGSRPVNEEIYRITTINNSEPIRITGSHKIHTVRGRIPACEIQKGDLLYFRPPQEEVEIPDLTDSRATLIGWFLAEGHLRRRSDQVKGEVFFSLNSQNERLEAENIKTLLELEFLPETHWGWGGRAKDIPHYEDILKSKSVKPITKRRNATFAGVNCVSCGAPSQYLQSMVYNKKPGYLCKVCNSARALDGLHVSRAAIHDSQSSVNSELQVYYKNQAAYDFFKQFAPVPGSKHKEMLSSYILAPKDQQRLIWDAFHLGDGHHERCGGIRFGITSPQLRDQFYVIAARLGINPRRDVEASETGTRNEVRCRVTEFQARTLTRDRTQGNKPAYFLYTSKMTLEQLHESKYAVDSDGNLLLTVSSVEKIPYTGPVYNICVDVDHTYHANGIAVNNSDTDIERLYESLGDSVPEELKEALNYGEAVPLNTNWRRGSYCVHLHRNRPPNEEYGQSIIQRCMDTLLRIENIKNANFQISSRNMAPKHLVTAPGVGKNQLDDLRVQIDLALLENVDSPIVCVLPETAVTLEDGTQKRIDQVRPGDFVLTEKGNSRRVKNTQNRSVDEDIYEIYARGMTAPVGITGNHRFFTTRGDVPASEIIVGDQLFHQPLQGSKTILSVESIRKIPYCGPVYNIEVEDDHSYLVENSCVHNCNFEVIWQVIGSNDRLLNTDSEYQTLRQDLATGLGTTVDMLTGAATYGGQRITLEMMNTCFYKDSFIRMADGTQRAIDQVHIGQRVITALGTVETVEQLHQREYAGDLITIHARGLTSPVICTPNHTFFTLRGDVKAEDIQEGDRLLSRVPCVETPQKGITDDLCYLVGWFLAEGHPWERKDSDNHTDGISFSLGGNKPIDMIAAERIKDKLIQVFPPEKYRSGSCWSSDGVKLPTSPMRSDGVLMVHYTNQAAHDFISRECGRYAQRKKLTERWMYLPLNQQRLILENWILGAGQILANGYASASTTSLDLRNQMIWICYRLGINVKPWARLDGIRGDESYIRNLSHEEALLGERIYGFDITIGEAQKIWSGITDGRIDIYNLDQRKEIQLGSRPPRFWDAEKIQFLKDNYKSIGPLGVAEHYGIKVGTVRTAYRRLGLSRPIQREQQKTYTQTESGGLTLEVKSVTREFYFGVVYDLGISHEHSYHVEGAAVHNSYLNFRDSIRKFVERNLFRPVAFAKGHYTEEEIEMWPRVRPEDIEVGDILIEERDGHLRRKRNQINVLWMNSTLRWNRISIRDNAEIYDQLFQLYQKGSLAVRYLLDLHNIDPEENSQAMLEDLGTPRDSVFNDFTRALYTATDVPQKIINQTDFIDRIMRGMKLGIKAQPALAPTAPGGLGGGGGGLSDMGGGFFGGGPGDVGGPPGMGLEAGGPGMPGSPGAGPGGTGATPGGEGGPPATGGATPGGGLLPVAASRRAASRVSTIAPEQLPGRLLDRATSDKLREIAGVRLASDHVLSPGETQRVIQKIEQEQREERQRDTGHSSRRSARKDNK